MLSFQVELLTGRYVAAAHHDRDEVEWPPHPARLYAALVATWAEGGQQADEAEALDWLAAQPAPRIAASEASARDAPTFFVPVNDASVLADHARPYQDLIDALVERQSAQDERDAAIEANDAKALGRAEKRSASAQKKLDAALARGAKVLAPAGSDKGLTGKGLTEKLQLLPELRKKQARRFPSCTPRDPVVAFTWEEAAPGEPTRAALAALAGRLVRLGHSSSLVSARLIDDPPAATWRPDQAGAQVLRWVGPGARGQLVQEHARHGGNEPRVTPAVPVRYAPEGAAEARVEVPRSAFGGDWLVFERAQREPLPLTQAAAVADALRAALMAHATEPITAVLSGHERDGGATRAPHAAFVPLPWVGNRWADGGLLGVAIAVPAGVDPEGRRQLLQAIGRLETAGQDHRIRLLLGRAGVFELRRSQGEPGRLNLGAGAWSRPSRLWLTATPIALDRNPGHLGDRDPARAARAADEAALSIAAACLHIGLPCPQAVEILPAPPLRGSRPARAFPPFPPKGDRVRRVLTHARLRFEAPVAGPILLGAGRFCGLGLCRPTGEEP